MKPQNKENKTPTKGESRPPTKKGRTGADSLHKEIHKQQVSGSPPPKKGSAAQRGGLGFFYRE
ncbi:unnamed protein product [Prunus armeniaca]|uniref:Uncharacterized protein n=1 Tax=Prunus armeniaca TaxID=36596 RepID=A0A6J5V2X1_PRUAR|nr:unnamed protein product [Prunus armeniaca]CAB4313814.1 unnamed protein product [Prunus armeniaca]